MALISSRTTRITGTAGETLAQYSFVYSNPANGKYYLADQTTDLTADCVGIVTQSGEIHLDDLIAIQVTPGLVSGFTNLTKGENIYLGTSGNLTQTMPTVGIVKPLGFAVSETQIFFNPSLGWNVNEADDTHTIESYFDTDTSLTENSNYKIPTQKAVKSYVDAFTVSSRNTANGYCGLDAGTKIPSGLLPSSITGALIYKGAWSASGGTYPNSPSVGWFYVVSVAGTISGTSYSINDWMLYNGTSWDKIANSTLVNHELTHLSGGTDEIDGDKIDVDYVPNNYTSDVADDYSTTTAQLASHLKGIDSNFDNFESKLSVTVLDFGGYLDGVNDDGPATQAALDYLRDNNRNFFGKLSYPSGSRSKIITPVVLDWNTAVRSRLVSVSVAAGGSGYVVGDVLTVVNPLGGNGTVTVTAVDSVETGVVTGIEITTTTVNGKTFTASASRGYGFSTTGAKSTTGGSGTLCTINVLAISNTAKNQLIIDCNGVYFFNYVPTGQVMFTFGTTPLTGTSINTVMVKNGYFYAYHPYSVPSSHLKFHHISNVSIDHCEFRHSDIQVSLHCVLLARINDCFFRETTSSTGLYLDSCNGILVENNSFTDMYSGIVADNANPSSDTQSQMLTIKNNWFEQMRGYQCKVSNWQHVNILYNRIVSEGVAIRHHDTAYAAYTNAVLPVSNGRLYRCITAGTSSSTKSPTFSTTLGAQITDGVAESAVVWQCEELPEAQLYLNKCLYVRVTGNSFESQKSATGFHIKIEDSADTPHGNRLLINANSFHNSNCRYSIYEHSRTTNIIVDDTNWYITGKIKSAIVNTGGSGYAVGDLLYPAAPGSTGILVVKTVSGTAVATVEVVNAGYSYTSGDRATTTNESGTNCVVTLTIATSTTVNESNIEVTV